MPAPAAPSYWRKLRRFVLLALLLLPIVWYAYSALRSQPRPPHPFAPDGIPLAMVHRGGAALGPENTLPTFALAAQLGVDILELDIHRSRDGAFVVLHDRRVDRTTDGQGTVAQMDLAQIRQLDAAYNWSPDGGTTYPQRGQGIIIPTLEEILRAFPAHRMVIELKSSEPQAAEPFCALLRTCGKATQVLAASFHADVVDAVRRACPEVATAATAWEGLSFFLLTRLHLEAAYRPRAEVLSVPPRLGSWLQVVDQRFVTAAHRHNMAVHVWTVDRPQAMQALLAAGVDGLITNYPERLLTVLGRAPSPLEH
ncbi:MAG: glycerophosphodiester phosphodiesterase [Candidatus Latescibacteria bacterium]|nr:glycerophosphodiester phosphodiesterase [Candidatus Latescibacterota bacterium]